MKMNPQVKKKAFVAPQVAAQPPVKAVTPAPTNVEKATFADKPAAPADAREFTALSFKDFTD